MKRMVFFLMVLVFVSCKEISFREPQPKAKRSLTSFPKNIQGKYLTLKDDGEVSRDTIVIHAKGYRFGYFDPADRSNGSNEEYEEGILGDSLVLKTFKGYYFLNFNENPEWMLRVLRQEKNGDLIFMAPEQEGVDFKDYLKKLSAEIPIDSFQIKDETLYQIDPTASELVKLIERGFFSRAVLKKVRQ